MYAKIYHFSDPALFKMGEHTDLARNTMVGMLRTVPLNHLHIEHVGMADGRFLLGKRKHMSEIKTRTKGATWGKGASKQANRCPCLFHGEVDLNHRVAGLDLGQQIGGMVETLGGLIKEEVDHLQEVWFRCKWHPKP